MNQCCNNYNFKKTGNYLLDVECDHDVRRYIYICVSCKSYYVDFRGEFRPINVSECQDDIMRRILE